MRSVLFVFAHQDDEVAAAPRILHELREGSAVTFVYLTDGAARRASAVQRNRETLAALEALGVPASRVHFPGADLPIADGHLVENLDGALEALERCAPPGVTEVFTLAREGGHHDHDAVNLVAAAFGTIRGLPVWELPLYHGHNTAGHVFRALSPIGAGWVSRRITLGDGLASVRLRRHYVSQRMTWLMLLPWVALAFAVRRREMTRRVDPARFNDPPHAGRVYFERHFRYARSRFETHARPFVEKHFTDTVTRRC